MGIFNNIVATAMTSGTTRTSDATWNRTIKDDSRADKRKELQKKALCSYAKATLDFDSFLPEGNSKQFIG